MTQDFEPIPPAPSAPHLECLTGVVERITFHNAENGWTVLKVATLQESNRLVTVVVHQAKVFAGSTMEFRGTWHHHPKFGEQFKADQVIEKTPASSAALEKYLGSGLIKGVGPSTAQRIVSYFKDRTLDVFENKIHELKRVPGIAEKKLEQIKVSWEEHRTIRDVMMFLQTYGISTLFSVKIYKAYGSKAIEVVSKNPYRLAQDIHGIGFFSADKIALNMGFQKDGKQRLAAGIQHVLGSSRESGHCFLTQNQIVESTVTLLEEEKARELILDILEDLLKADQIKSRQLLFENEMQKCYYSKALYYDELSVAESIEELLRHNYEVESDLIQQWIKAYCEKFQISLSDEQEQAVNGIAAESFSILTGGPGCGKTTTTKVLVQLLKSMKLQILLAAPTGRAAQRMSEVIGSEAKTIHRLLEWSPHEGGFVKNEEEPLEADFLIVDECSMLDISLASNLLRAVPKRCKVLFIGDPDQLPAVGAGNVLSDLLQVQRVPRFQLTKIFRQAEKSSIIRYAHEINSGKVPQVESPFIRPQAFQEGVDCLFIESEETGSPNCSLSFGLTGLDMVVRLYIKTVREWLGKDIEVQVLTPQVRGTLGTVNLNTKLQEAANPPKPGKLQIQMGEKILRVGDRVIQMRNNYDLNVYNGDIGWIESVDTEEFSCCVRFGGVEARRVEFQKEDLTELQLAYAVTIHKSQGSEFSVVILPVSSQHYHMLFRNLIYTGLTRAKKLAIFVGSQKAFTTAIQKVDNRKRQTALVPLFRKGD